MLSTTLSRTLLIGTFALVGCGAPSDHPRPDVPTWRIDAEPVVQIGGSADDTVAALGNAVGAFRIDDSLIVVVDRGYHSLRYFDLRGTLRDSAGRQGDGPGEFQYIARAFFCRDTLFVQDIKHRRFEVFSSRGAHVRHFEQQAPAGAAFAVPYKMACGQSGAWIANGWDSPDYSTPGRSRGLVPYWLLDGDGRVTVTLGDHPGSERLVTPGGSGPHPLGKEPVIAIGATRAYIGTADSLTVLVYGLDGTPLPPIHLPYQDLATTDADRARFRLLDTLGKEQSEIKRQMADWEIFEFPPTVPAYTAMLVDHSDNLWLRLFPRSTENTVAWVVFSPDGTQLGRLDLPGTFEAFDIGEDYLLGIETQIDDGSEHVRLYRLHRE